MSTAIATQNSSQNRIPVVAGQRGLLLNGLDEMWRFAQYVAKSGLAPKGIENPEAIIVALQMGAEIGLTPMASLQNIAVINGRPAVWGDAMLGVCRASGVFDEETFEETISGDGDARKAVCIVRRLPKGKPVRREFTVAQAKKAGLYGKSGPWSTYPERMLQMRARSLALRDCFTDFLRGTLCAEEMQDAVPVKVVSVASAPSTLDDLANRLEAPQETQEVVDEQQPEDADVIVVDESEADPFTPPDELEALRIDLREVFADCSELKSVAEKECALLDASSTQDRQAVVRQVAEETRERIRSSRGHRSTQKTLT